MALYDAGKQYTMFNKEIMQIFTILSTSRMQEHQTYLFTDLLALGKR